MYMSFARLAFANKLLRCLGLGTRDIERQKCLEFCTRLIKACQTGFCLILTLCSILFTHGFNNFVPICLSDCVHVFAACFLNSEVIDLIFVLLNPKLGFSWMPFSWKSLTDSNQTKERRVMNSDENQRVCPRLVVLQSPVKFDTMTITDLQFSPSSNATLLKEEVKSKSTGRNETLMQLTSWR